MPTYEDAAEEAFERLRVINAAEEVASPRRASATKLDLRSVLLFLLLLRERREGADVAEDAAEVAMPPAAAELDGARDEPIVSDEVDVVVE